MPCLHHPYLVWKFGNFLLLLGLLSRHQRVHTLEYQRALVSLILRITCVLGGFWLVAVSLGAVVRANFLGFCRSPRLIIIIGCEINFLFLRRVCGGLRNRLVWPWRDSLRRL